jgi:hypothetical protein
MADVLKFRRTTRPLSKTQMREIRSALRFFHRAVHGNAAHVLRVAMDRNGLSLRDAVEKSDAAMKKGQRSITIVQRQLRRIDIRVKP